MSESGSNREAGFAILVVAIALAALALIMSGVLYMTRRHMAAANTDITQLRLQSALDGATATAAAQLSFGEPLSASFITQKQVMDIGGIPVDISARIETSKFNLNAGDPALLAALLEASGISTQLAQRVSDEAADWRDADGEARASGAEAASYLAAERSYTPPNHAFQTVSELSLLLDGNDDLVQCLEPDVTVYGGSSDIAAQYVSVRLQKALALVHSLPSPQQSVIGASVSNGRSTIAGDIFEIDERIADGNSGVTMFRRTILRITGDPRDPVRILLQQPAIPDEASALKACARFEQSKAR